MSLFGAASSGVDPKSGSYLNKEQRIAMFQASRGQGGGAGGGGVAGGGRRSVNPQSSIVVANKMTSVVQKLQTSYQASTTAVSEQAQANKQSLENLANTVANSREQTLINEKRETRDDRIEKESRLRNTKEKLIEGISSAAAGLANAGQRVAQKAIQPIQGLLGKILRAFGALAAAWTVDNLPTLLGAWDDFKDGLPDFRDNLIGSLGKMRGVWSIIDFALKKVGPGIRRVAKAVGRTVRFVGRKIFSISKRIFGAIGEFVLNLVKRVVGKIIDLGKWAKNAIGGAARSAGNLLSGGADVVNGARQGANVADVANGARQGTTAAGEVIDDVKAPKGNWLTKIGDNVKGGLKKMGNFGKSMFTKGMDGLRSMGTSIQDATSGLTGAGSTKPLDGEQKGFLSGILDKVMNKSKDMNLPTGLMGKLKGGMKILDKFLRRVPFVGFAIDYMLNAQEGMKFQENIARSLSSSLAGMVGAGVGAKIGGGIGFAAGTVVPGLGNVVGAAIGAALGGIIGGMAAGTLGDASGAAAYSAFTGKETTDTGLIGGEAFDNFISGNDAASETATKVSGSDAEATIQVAPSSAAVVGEGLSTPEGLSMPTGNGAAETSVTGFDLPPIDASGEEPMTQDDETELSEIDQEPIFSSSNPETAFYRQMAASYYDLMAV